ncbi:MAG: class I SAM-dependent methyltransferase [Candidatus Omnitrophica bacterium]|nr:class I SAM-dependent methyltransferase [Candidatus Omnitrophota bacterium]MCM8826594.1 class I SAM-dependent methyltransferase [Candidatus Omnitrophota bacterium]
MIIKNKFHNIFWNIYAFFYDNLTLYYPAYYRQLNQIYSLIKNYLNKDSIVLDFGCGTGGLLKIIEKEVGCIIGMDRSFAMIKRAKRKVNKSLFVIADANNLLPFKKESFSLITVINSLYMLINPEKAIQDFHSSLKSNGRLIISNPLWKPSLPKIVKALFKEEGIIRGLKLFFRLFLVGILNLFITEEFKKEVFHSYSEEELTNILERVGFRIEKITTTYILNSNILVCAVKVSPFTPGGCKRGKKF